MSNDFNTELNLPLSAGLSTSSHSRRDFYKAQCHSCLWTLPGHESPDVLLLLRKLGVRFLCDQKRPFPYDVECWKAIDILKLYK